MMLAQAAGGADTPRVGIAAGEIVPGFGRQFTARATAPFFLPGRRARKRAGQIPGVTKRRSTGPAGGPGGGSPLH